MVKTANGKIYDLSKHEYPPSKCPNHSEELSCDKCLVINAWPERVSD